MLAAGKHFLSLESHLFSVVWFFFVPVQLRIKGWWEVKIWPGKNKDLIRGRKGVWSSLAPNDNLVASFQFYLTELVYCLSNAWDWPTRFAGTSINRIFCPAHIRYKMIYTRSPKVDKFEFTRKEAKFHKKESCQLDQMSVWSF